MAKTVHVMLETRAKVFFFRVRESNLFIRESFAKVGHCPHSVTGCQHNMNGLRN